MVGPKVFQIVLRPPPGSRFSLKMIQNGQDVVFEGPSGEGQARKNVEWLRSWIDQYLEPIAAKDEAMRAKREAESDEIRQSRVEEEIQSLIANSEHNAIKPRAAKGANRSANFKPEMFESGPPPFQVKQANVAKENVLGDVMNIPEDAIIVEKEIGGTRGHA